MHKILVHAQDSCACTTLLCMHNTLVHALEGPGPKAGTQQKHSRPRPDPQLLFFILDVILLKQKRQRPHYA